MKKLSKDKKQKLKESLLRILHVLGYISIGLVVLLSIIVSVNACNRNKEDHNETALRVNQPKYSISEPFTVGTLYNYNEYGDIYVKANSVYYVDKLTNLNYVEIGIQGYTTNNVQANSGIYVIKNQETVYYYIFNQCWIYNSKIYVNDINGGQTIIADFTSDDYYLVVFDSNRIFKPVNSSPTDYAGLYNFFNGALVYVDDTISTQSHGSEYLSLNLNWYYNFVNDNWVRGGNYLDPFVVNYNGLRNRNVYANFQPCPLKINNNVYNSFSFNSNYNRFQLGYNYGNSSSTNVAYNVVSTLYNEEVVVYRPNNYGASFITYCGCYKWHNFYDSFLQYAYLLHTGETEGNLNVYTDLNIQVDIYQWYQWYEGQTSPQSVMNILSNAILYVNSQVYSWVNVQYDVGDYNHWHFVYGNSNESTHLTANTLPQIRLCIYYGPYSSIRDIIANTESSYIGLLEDYDPNYRYGVDPMPPVIDPTNNDNVNGVFDLFGLAFSSVADVLNISILGSFTLGSLIFLPLVVTIVIFVVQLFKR